MGESTLKIVSWNIAGREAPLKVLLSMGADIALLQEAKEPSPEVAKKIAVDPGAWYTTGGDADRPWRAAVAKLSKRAQVEWIESRPIGEARRGDLAVGRLGTLAAARVVPPVGDPFVVVSMYAPWTRPHHSTNSSWIISDASAHRVVSDLSELIGRQRGHRIIAAGDLNILNGYGEYGSPYWSQRYETVFTRMEALGLAFVGPQSPHGRQAHPWPSELPAESKNVPTYHSSKQTPCTATRQLDFVFASKSIAHDVRVCALNAADPAQWGPSDHCRVLIKVSLR